MTEHRFFFFKQKTAYEMRISDWSSDVCSSDLPRAGLIVALCGIGAAINPAAAGGGAVILEVVEAFDLATLRPAIAADLLEHRLCVDVAAVVHLRVVERDVTDRLVAFLRDVGVERLQPLAEVKIGRAHV